jgi:hypothetical protein
MLEVTDERADLGARSGLRYGIRRPRLTLVCN